jgi:hypothetical protein
MTERTEAISSRGRLLEAVRKELVEFERRENEFRKQDREERAAELRLPVFKNSLSRGRLSWRPREVSGQFGLAKLVNGALSPKADPT